MTDCAKDFKFWVRRDCFSPEQRANDEANDVAEYLGAFNFGRSVQRVEDQQAGEASRGVVVLAHMFCAFSGFIVALIVCGLMAHAAATIGHLVYGFFGLIFGFVLGGVLVSRRFGLKAR